MSDEKFPGYYTPSGYLVVKSGKNKQFESGFDLIFFESENRLITGKTYKEYELNDLTTLHPMFSAHFDDADHFESVLNAIMNQAKDYFLHGSSLQ